MAAKKKTSRKKKTTTRRKTTATRATGSRRKTTTRSTGRKKTTSTGIKARTKSQIFSDLAESTGLTKKEVASVFDEMGKLIKKDLGTRGPGVFTVPGLMKIKKRAVPRKPARKNVWVPLLKEFRDIPAKPARKTVKVLPLKALKEMV